MCLNIQERNEKRSLRKSLFHFLTFILSLLITEFATLSNNPAHYNKTTVTFYTEINTESHWSFEKYLLVMCELGNLKFRYSDIIASTAKVRELTALIISEFIIHLYVQDLQQQPLPCCSVSKYYSLTPTFPCWVVVHVHYIQRNCN